MPAESKSVYCFDPEAQKQILNGLINLTNTVDEKSALLLLRLIEAIHSATLTKIFPMPDEGSVDTFGDNAPTFDRFRALQFILQSAKPALSGVDIVLLMVLISSSVPDPAIGALDCKILYTDLHQRMADMRHGSKGAIRKRIQYLQQQKVICRTAGGVGKTEAAWQIPAPDFLTGLPASAGSSSPFDRLLIKKETETP